MVGRRPGKMQRLLYVWSIVGWPGTLNGQLRGHRLAQERMAYLRAYPVAATNSSRITVFSAGDASLYRGAIWSNNSLFDVKLKSDLT